MQLFNFCKYYIDLQFFLWNSNFLVTKNSSFRKFISSEPNLWFSSIEEIESISVN